MPRECLDMHVRKAGDFERMYCSRTRFWKGVATHIVEELSALGHGVCYLFTKPLFRECCSYSLNLSDKTPSNLILC
jgi:hypothetical protein